MRIRWPAMALSGMTVTAALVLAGCGSPQSAAHVAANGPSAQDRTWVVQTHQANMAEITVGALAKARGSSQDVRRIGDTLVSDHTGSDTPLRRAAGRLGMGLPLRPDAAQRHTAEELGGQSGQAFDRDFIRTQITAHHTAITQTERESRAGRAAALRVLAQKTLPTLKKHLWMLQKGHS